ncbi:LysR family transcriptional regulator [Dechloromonas denitrificans]|uniref:LysR family transcriptional regulator n=1 Tax=Dechloromonas denitrificans TaxID=281362 RepID=UPI001CF87386|nr:LysR family transcriptional regulator [Dechloromonas denitrificans]UCV02432.1 LysR family transcriptional regulator [Dechloromonas denitrificans]
MDRLTAVRVFVEVADRGSLTQTAEHLEMSAAMVSRYLAAVEDWFEARLLHRTTRKVSLTDAGLAALPACRQMLDIAEEARHIAAERSREPAGVLRVTTSSSFADAQLTAALIDFQQHYPQVEIVLSVGDKPTDLVAERVDLAVRITNTLDPTMITRPLARCRSMLCASPDYLQRHGLPLTADDLRQHRCIAHAFGIGKQYRLTRSGETITVPVNWSFHTNETAVLRRAVLSGAGIGMLPTYYLGDDLRAGRLVHLLPDHEPDVLGIHAIYLSRRHQPLALRLLVDFLAARFAGEPAPWDLALNVQTQA